MREPCGRISFCDCRLGANRSCCEKHSTRIRNSVACTLPVPLWWSESCVHVCSRTLSLQANIVCHSWNPSLLTLWGPIVPFQTIKSVKNEQSEELVFSCWVVISQYVECSTISSPSAPAQLTFSFWKTTFRPGLPWSSSGRKNREGARDELCLVNI